MESCSKSRAKTLEKSGAVCIKVPSMTMSSHQDQQYLLMRKLYGDQQRLRKPGKTQRGTMMDGSLWRCHPFAMEEGIAWEPGLSKSSQRRVNVNYSRIDCSSHYENADM
jgi:hypothetical protein